MLLFSLSKFFPLSILKIHPCCCVNNSLLMLTTLQYFLINIHQILSLHSFCGRYLDCFYLLPSQKRTTCALGNCVTVSLGNIPRYIFLWEIYLVLKETLSTLNLYKLCPWVVASSIYPHALPTLGMVVPDCQV
jgi:hypothetical protein